MARDVFNHALHCAGNGKGSTAGQRVAGVGGEICDFSSRHMQASGSCLKRTQHDAVARQDNAAQKSTVGIDSFNRHGGTHHHHHAGFFNTSCQQPVVRANQGHPAIRAEPRGVIVAIGKACFLRC